jgi:hypothetical protein
MINGKGECLTLPWQDELLSRLPCFNGSNNAVGDMGVNICFAHDDLRNDVVLARTLPPLPFISKITHL